MAENTYQLNGLNITNFSNGLGSTFVPFEFVQEMQIKTGGYEAEFGRSTGGVVNMVTKSGTNSFHGSLFGYFEPEGLQTMENDTFWSANQDETRRVLRAERVHRWPGCQGPPFLLRVRTLLAAGHPRAE